MSSTQEANRNSDYLTMEGFFPVEYTENELNLYRVKNSILHPRGRKLFVWID